MVSQTLDTPCQGPFSHRRLNSIVPKPQLLQPSPPFCVSCLQGTPLSFCDHTSGSACPPSNPTFREALPQALGPRAAMESETRACLPGSLTHSPLVTYAPVQPPSGRLLVRHSASTLGDTFHTWRPGQLLHGISRYQRLHIYSTGGNTSTRSSIFMCTKKLMPKRNHKESSLNRDAFNSEGYK